MILTRKNWKILTISDVESYESIGDFLEDFLEASALGDFSWHTRHWVSFTNFMTP